jgi:Immunity protein 26
MMKKPSRMSHAELRRFIDSIVGSFVAIPLNGEYGFGRVAREARIACYDVKASNILPIAQVKRAPVLFVVGVHFDAYASGRWQIIGKEPLEPPLAQSVKFFRQDVATGAVDIYVEGTFQPYAGEDLSKMERLASWDENHVEDRLRNHFAGIPDPNTEHLKVKPLSEFPSS